MRCRPARPGSAAAYSWCLGPFLMRQVDDPAHDRRPRGCIGRQLKKASLIEVLEIVQILKETTKCSPSRFSEKLKTRPNTQGDHQIQTPRFSGKLKTNLSILLAVSAALAACGDGGGSASLPKAAQINAVLATGSQTVTASMRTLWQTY